MKTFLFFVSVSFLAPSANAFIDVCELQKLPLDSRQLNNESVRKYQQNLINECNLSLKYKKLESELAKSGVSAAQISFYQAMRFVQFDAYKNAEFRKVPIQKVYQKTRAASSLPVDQRTTEIWDNWYFGIQQLPAELSSLRAGNSFQLEDLKRIHRGLFTVSDEKGDFAWDPQPGIIKTPYEHDKPWWTFKSEVETNKALGIVSELNQVYQTLNLTPMLPVGLPPGTNNLLNIRDGAIYSTDSRMITDHLNIYFAFLNSMLTQARSGQHMIWQDQLFSPAQLAFFIQQYYVAMHPFFEGNGRTSRFMQELVLRLFGLPHGASGYLMDDDILSSHQSYYDLAIKKTSEVLDSIQSCATSEYPRLLKKMGELRSAKAERRLSYKCRLVN